MLLGRQLKIFPAKYSSNWKIIEDLRHGLCDADKVIHCLASDLNLQIEEVRQMILGITVSPQLEIHTTDRCNLKCSYCAFDRSLVDLSVEQALRTVNVFSPKTITFSGGGENMLNRQFPVIVKLIAIKYPEIKK